MIPAKKVLKPQLKGDTFNGVRFTLSPPTDLTGATIRTQFRRGGKSAKAEKELTTGAGITVEDEVNGVFVWDPFIMNLAVATYYYDVEITFATGEVKTYIEGTIDIIQDTSY